MQDVQRPISKECPVCGQVFEPEAVGSTCPDDNSLLLLRSNHPLLGKLVADRYRLVELIGEGGWSVVFRAEHTSLSREYAVKVLHPHLSNDGDNLRRFQQEAEAASRLNHQNIASVYDYGLLSTGQPYLVMDFLQGQSLRTLLDNNGGKLPWSRAANLFLQACEGFNAAHEKGLIHRDIKPANIMIVDTAGGDTVKILDFGLAKFMAETRDASLTETGHTIGTPSYMSPEQCMGRQLDGRTDIYSLGCVMYETLSGTNPFKAGSYLESMNLHLSHTPRSLTTASSRGATEAGFPVRAAILVEKALSRQEEHRQQSMAELRRDIQAACAELSSTAALIEQVTHKVRRLFGRVTPRAVLVSSIACGVLLVGAFAWSQWQLAGGPSPHTTPTDDDYTDSLSPHDLQNSEFGKRLVLEPNRPALPQLQKIKDPEKYMAISVASTHFTDADLPALLPFRNVKEIDLAMTGVTDRGLPIFKQFPDLSKLSLHGDEHITDASIDTFYELPMLRRLNLSLTSVTGAGVRRLAGIKQLRKLHLKGLPVDDSDLESLAPLRQLELLDVERTKVTDRSMKVIGNFQMMLLLNVRHTAVTDAGIAELSKLPALLVLDLEGSRITGGAAESFKRFKRIRDLEVSDTRFDNKGLAELSKIPSLAYINLTSSRVTPAFVKAFRKNNPNIKIDYLEPK